jgi:hypothetical protein
VIDSEKIESLFKEGLHFYRAGEYFEAHESWEDLWSDYYLPDRKFIQGLIQLSVSFVHLENGNIKGAKSLLNKCTEKFKEFDGLQRGVEVNNLLIQKLRHDFWIAFFEICLLDFNRYRKYDTKTRKIMQFCQLNLLTIDYPMLY